MQYTQRGLPRWRGFNLLGMYTTRHEGVFPEEDFQLIAELGFDFVRLPMSYRTWTVGGDLDSIEPVYPVNERALEAVDSCVRAGEKYGLHINLNLHRAPGYCINPGEKEPFDLWKDEEAVKAFAWHWEMFAKLYKDVLQGYNIGYALWNFRGQFGILDSMRKDCKYEEWHGHLPDRQMLEILKAH